MKELTLEITGRCDVGCLWCSSNAEPDGKHMPRRRVESLLMKYKVECDVVRFSGGEPTLHPDLARFCDLAKKLGYFVVLLTNGCEENMPTVDRYVVGVWHDKSLRTALELKRSRCDVRMEVVLVEGRESLIFEATRVSLMMRIPLRLLILQKQGRGENCSPLELISWTGDKGCRRNEKISILHDGRVITCSALKDGECVLNLEV